ncbi:MAG: hotdog fold thioesterase [Candidatus Methanosuratincola sp.]
MFREEPYTDMQELISKDRIASLLGVKMLEWGPGRCCLEMVVDENMLNAYGSCHGSAIFALADIAFAVSCNSGGVKSVALSMSVNYRRPVKKGERLIAEAKEESVGSTTALCRIRITNGDGKVVALADGLAYRIRN